MIKGLYAAASAMMTNLFKQNVISHNLANLDTPGFRQLLTANKDWRTTQVRNIPQEPNTVGNLLADYGRIGLGVEVIDPVSDFSGGALRQTEEMLDVAVEGPGFFTVETPHGVRYTKDGRLLRDAADTLVTAEGYFVLDANGQRITLPPASPTGPVDPIVIGTDGAMSVADGPVFATLGIAAFTNPRAELVGDQPNYFAAAGRPTSQDVGQVVQGFLEDSNVNPTLMMSQMVEVNRAYEAAQRLVQTQDELLGRAISTLGRL
jgi:flagellar basal body rod protein FlgG